MIVNGFIEPWSTQLPMEYAVELNRLIELADGRLGRLSEQLLSGGAQPQGAERPQQLGQPAERQRRRSAAGSGGDGRQPGRASRAPAGAQPQGAERPQKLG
ncbi:MAG: hypothetical protein U5K30_11800 [Acidimicrobiales bacterium]|nr:hypothetical protein [Acidimicrobiales bacterium]